MKYNNNQQNDENEDQDYSGDDQGRTRSSVKSPRRPTSETTDDEAYE